MTAVMPIVRVAILTDSRLTEMALPTELPLREIVPAVERLVGPATRDGHALDGDEPTDSRPAGRLSLAPIGGAPFSLDASLDTVGVVDGDLLALQEVTIGPAAPGIVEDIADAAMIFSEARRKPWGIRQIQVGALAAGIIAAFVATGLAVTHRVIVGSPAGLAAAAVIGALTALTGLLSRTRSPRAGLALSIAALVPIAAALALSVPGRFGPAQLALAAAGVAAWSLISMLVPTREQRDIGFFTSFFTAAAVGGISVLLAAGAELLWQLTILSLGCGLIVAALLVAIGAAQLSALCARFPLPVIAAPGDPTPSAPSLRVLEDLPRRVRTSDAHQSGFIAAAVLLSVLGSVAIALRPEALSGWGAYVVAATAATAVLRARIWDSAACKAWLLAQPYLLGVVLSVVYTATGRYAAAFGTAVVLTTLMLAWVVVALNPRIASPDSYSLPVRRLLSFVGSGLDASLIPVMGYLVGLFGWVLNR